MSESDRPQAIDMPQPVAWANEDDDGLYEIGLSEAKAHYILERAPNRNYSHRNPRIVPLYRSPTLTDAEREAIERAIAAQEHRAAEMHPRSWIAADIDDDCDRLRALLERTR
jgi:hypothetical protein